jgi:hypothetical protein
MKAKGERDASVMRSLKQFEHLNTLIPSEDSYARSDAPGSTITGRRRGTSTTVTSVNLKQAIAPTH